MNINNPHFMIQQGKITKVINMRPKDLLGLIEEVSGTRMYEMKRANAVKLIQKKEKKLQDIAVVLEEEIHPTIERLRKEKLEYFNFVSLKEEMQRFQRFDVAYRFYCAQQLLQQGTSDLDDLLRKKTETEAEISKIDGEMRDLQKYIDQINAERQQMDVPLQAVRKKKDEIEKTLAKRQSDEKSARRELKQAADALEDLKKEEKKLSKKLQEKKQSRSLESQQVEAAEKTLNEAKEKLTHAERKLDQLYASGGSGEQGAGRGGEGEGDSLHAQLKRKKTRLAELEAEEFNLNTEIKHLDAELTTIKATAEKYDKV
ncbi:SMC protein [Cystoisospora suis]|uniref:SMC protein n=1 Tax=Cystoisospora suis TaxID=483139 RepID=A0A2C6KHH1_9APIC|nr:SMC protein [Cystoisospora suis]